MRRALAAGAFVLLAGSPWAAVAQSGASCTLRTPPVNFGVYDTLAPAASPPVSGLMSLECTRFGGSGAQRVDYEIRLGRGNAPTHAPRFMLNAKAPGERLDYNLYLESLGVVWGDGTGGTGVAGGQIVVTPGRPVRSRDHTLLGQIPPRQTVSPGTYQDTVVVTVIFN